MPAFVAIVLGILFWHLGAVSMIGRFAGPVDEPWLAAPKGMILNPYHLWGCLAAFLAMVILVASNYIGLLPYGIIIATFLMVVDTSMIYRALRDCER